jgi:predicted alpha/beta hydrolase family esterase
VLLALFLVLHQVDAGPEPTTPARELIDRTTEGEFVDQLLDDGRYTRFGTKDSGPVHVWRPRSYKREQAVTIVYVHGFFTSVDAAMREHQLTAQFRDSGRNALFIVPEARSWRTDPIYWPDLEKLIAAVEKRLKLQRPKGPIVLVGHSGAYKTIAGWLSHEQVSQVLLVDGLYGNESDFKAWLEVPNTEFPHQLVLVGFDTHQRAEWMVRKHAASVELDALPWLYDELPGNVRKAPLVCVQSERLDHMQLVTDGRLLPWLIHAFR